MRTQNQSSSTFRLWGTTTFRGIQKHTAHKIILDTVSYRRPQASSRKEKLDKQLTRQSSSTPSLSITDGHHYRKVLYDTKAELGDKIDKVAVMICKLAKEIV